MYWNGGKIEGFCDGVVFNNNIRCIETLSSSWGVAPLLPFNNNIRCIETLITPFDEIYEIEFNNNIRCIETKDISTL